MLDWPTERGTGPKNDLKDLSMYLNLVTAESVWIRIQEKTSSKKHKGSAQAYSYCSAAQLNSVVAWLAYLHRDSS